jgi:RNA polymerase subunit RPABC4/transcription elongation factor Spt4
MEYLDKIKKEPRIIISILNFIFFLLPWVSVKVDVFGFSESTSASAFRLMSDSASMFLLILIALFLIAIPFIPVVQKFKKLLYLVVPVLSIILTFAITAHATGSYDTEYFDIGVNVNHGIGFWLSILAYLGLIAVTFIFDFKINKQSFANKGVKGVFSDVAGQFSSSASEMAAGLSMPKTEKSTVCPSCNANVAKGTKFCPKCGAPIPQAKKCATCGAELAEGTSFCPGCGSKVE